MVSKGSKIELLLGEKFCEEGHLIEPTWKILVCVSPRKINMEPENTPLEKEKHLPTT